MIESYGLGYLEDKFLEHAEQSAESREVCRRFFEKSNPGEELPEYMKDDFSLPLALRTMLVEILRLGREVERLGGGVMYKFNKIKSRVAEDMLTKCYLEKRLGEALCNNLLGNYGSGNRERFGTAPVRQAYWRVESVPSQVKYYYTTLPTNPSPKVVFRKPPDPRILKEAWVMNLKTNKENGMIPEEMKEAHKGIDVSEELKDLLKVYTDADTELKDIEQYALDRMASVMKEYLKVREEREKVGDKIAVLKLKMDKVETCT